MSERYIVLDLDATLLHTFDNYKALAKLISEENNLAYLKSRIYNLKLFNPSSNKNHKYYSFWGIYRPFLAEFVEYIIQEFDDIFIWSAGNEKYVKSVVDLIFEPYEYKPKIIFYDTHCYISEDREVVVKDLAKLYNASKDIYSSASDKCGPNETNTYVIDDRMDTMSKNADNGILIHPYNLFELPDDPNEDDVRMFIESARETDNSLKDLIIFFDKNKNSDIRKIIKNNIFNEKKESKRPVRTIVKLSPSHNIHL